ncbi:glycosyltransferase [Vibrio fluvialis]|nr:glycosyltransferase [Vibrio fluvialis]
MKENWRILLLDTKKKNPNHYIALGIFNALKEHVNVDFVVKADYGNAIELAKKNQCNLFFAFDGEELEPAFCSRLKTVCGRSIVWNVEDPYEIDVNKNNAKYFDLVFTNDKSSLIEYGNKGRHLPLAACPKLHFHEVDNNKLRYDLFFAGTAWPNRVSLLKSIEKNIQNIRLKLALPTNEHLPKIDLTLHKSAYNWRTPNSEFAKFSNRSAIVLSLHRQFTASNGRAEASTPGPRLFEVAMAGGFQLVDRNIPGISDYFVEGEDFAAFASPEECLNKIKYYLEHPLEREKIAISAQNKVLELHTYKQRVTAILDEIAKIDTSTIISYKKNEKDKVIFVVCHNTVNNTPFGGVEIYLDIINRNIGEGFDIYYYVPDHKSPEGVRYFLLNSDYKVVDELKFSAPLPIVSEHMLSCEQRERAFGTLLNKYNVDLVHYQHLIRHIPSLPFISKALGIPSIFSMHDYFPISHRFNLIDYTGKYHKHSFRTIKNIDISLNELENIEIGSQAKRTAFWDRLLETFDIIHTNSIATREMLISTYPNLNNDKLITRGIPFDNHTDYQKIKCASINSEYLHVLVLGNFTNVKGADTLLRIFNNTRNSKIKFDVYGQIALEYEAIVNQLNLEHVVFHGTYDNNQLHSILSNKHVSLHLSIWPETYCITLSEAWESGLVPIVTDIGALGERVTEDYGFKVEVEDIGTPVEILERLQTDRRLLAQLMSNIRSANLTEKPEAHIEWLKNLYSKFSSNNNYPYISENENKIDLVTCGVKLDSIIWATVKNRTMPIIHKGNTVNHRIPRHPYYLFKFIVGQIENRGLRVTVRKIIDKIKEKYRIAL